MTETGYGKLALLGVGIAVVLLTFAYLLSGGCITPGPIPVPTTSTTTSTTATTTSPTLIS